MSRPLSAVGHAVNRLRHSPPVNQFRYRFYKTILAWPRRRECNLCGWRGRHFLTYRHRHVLCPQCGSQIRHRLIGAALAHAPGLTAGFAIDGAAVLHLVPEYCLESLLAPRARRYVTGGWNLGASRLDATRLPFADGRFDVLIACDLLEHIADERAALAEMHRVLRPGGVAVLTVPTSDGAQTTVEDPSIVEPEARERAYGQSDHVRLYGADVAARVAAAGFTVSVVTRAAFPPALVERHVLAPPVPLTGPLAFNDRLVMFAKASGAQPAARPRVESDGGIRRRTSRRPS